MDIIAQADRLKLLDDLLDLPSKCTVVHDHEPDKLNTERG